MTQFEDMFENSLDSFKELNTNRFHEKYARYSDLNPTVGSFLNWKLYQLHRFNSRFNFPFEYYKGV